jgi:hypothetical protein
MHMLTSPHTSLPSSFQSGLLIAGQSVPEFAGLAHTHAHLTTHLSPLASCHFNFIPEWTGLLIAGQSVPEFAGLTDWTILRMKFKNAFDAVETSEYCERFCDVHSGSMHSPRTISRSMYALFSL